MKLNTKNRKSDKNAESASVVPDWRLAYGIMGNVVHYSTDKEIAADVWVYVCVCESVQLPDRKQLI